MQRARTSGLILDKERALVKVWMVVDGVRERRCAVMRGIVWEGRRIVLVCDGCRDLMRFFLR